MEKIEECIICAILFPENEFVVFHCNHKVCLSCFSKLIQKNNQCPFCRAVIDQTPFAHKIIMDVRVEQQQLQQELQQVQQQVQQELQQVQQELQQHQVLQQEECRITCCKCSIIVLIIMTTGIALFNMYK